MTNASAPRVLVPLLLLLFAPLAAAGGGHDHGGHDQDAVEAPAPSQPPDAPATGTESGGHDHGASPASSESSSDPYLARLGTPTGIAFVVLVALAVACVALLVRADGPLRTGLLAGLVVLSLLVGLTGAYAGGMDLDGGAPASSAVPERTFGPKEDPLHMLGFYETFDPSTAPHADSVVADPTDLPPPTARTAPADVRLELTAREVVAPLTEDSTYYYWTYDGRAPGTVLRVRQGDTVTLTLHNDATSTHPHSIDLHAVHGPGDGAGATETPPGESRTFTFEAKNAGFYVYHCASGDPAVHVANQMFGAILVEPRDGLPPVDREFVVMQGEVYALGGLGASGFQGLDVLAMLDEEPTYYTFNGVPRGLLGENALRARTGETVRIHFGNAGVAATSAFHVIGEQFDRVWREGALESAPEGPGVQTVPVAPGSGLVVDLTLDEPGTYPLVDHALARLDRGAWGLLEVTGEAPPPPVPDDVHYESTDDAGLDPEYAATHAVEIPEEGAQAFTVRLAVQGLATDRFHVNVLDPSGQEVGHADAEPGQDAVVVLDAVPAGTWTVVVEGTSADARLHLTADATYQRSAGHDHAGHDH